MGFQLTREQSAAVTDRGGELLVSAAAGSGKTRVLVERLLRRVEEERINIDRFLVITYTRAAAAELRGRIAAELSDRLALHPEDAFLRRQATLVYQASIATIDGFCAQFLREEGHRLELEHDFRLCEENEGRILLEDVLAEVLEEHYRTITPESDFACLVDTMSDGRNDSRLVQILLDVRGKIQSHAAPERWLKEQTAVFALEGVTDAGATPWGEVLLRNAKRQGEYRKGRLMEALELCEGDEKLQKSYAPAVQTALNGFVAFSAATERGWDEAREKLLRVEFPRMGAVRNCEDIAAQERIKAIWKDCKDQTEKLRKLFADDSAGLLEDMRAVYPAVRGLFALVGELETAFAKEKRRRGVLDFSDLEHLTAKLLTDEDGKPSELARRWSERFEEVMVDEYQDANAIQDTLFTALSDEGKKLFLVGDVKQSIYRFRLADPTIFLKKYAAFPLWEQAEEEKPRKILLSRNFRSRPQVLEACNDLFRGIMSRSFGEMDYTDAEALYPREGPFAGNEEDYRLELNILDCSDAGEDGEEGGKPRRDELEARFVAKRIRALLDEKFPVDDGEGGLRPIRPEDIVILLRSPGTVLGDYAKALAEQNIPWEADGGGDIFSAVEIRVVISLLKMIDNPRQDVALIAALRSPVFGFSADRLARIRAATPHGDFYTALTHTEGEDVAEFLSALSRFRRWAVDESCDRLIWKLYDETNLLGIFSAMDEGTSRRSNLLLLAQLARDFENGGHRGLYSFLNYLQRLEEQGKSPAMPKTGAGGGVKMMSIHRSKGLEFPVVILAGLARQMNMMDQRAPMLFHPELGVGPWRLDLERMLEYPTLSRLAVGRQMEQEQAAEELRLLYVAMTRAKEKLILSCALTGGRKALDKLTVSAGIPVEPQALSDHRSPAQWILLYALARPEAAFLREDGLLPRVDSSVTFASRWNVIWRDREEKEEPCSLSGRSESMEERQEESAEQLAERFRWVYPYETLAELPSKLTATQLKGRNLDDEAAQEAPAAPSAPRFDRPRFAAEQMGLTSAQKGTALHLVMQYIDFDRCDTLEGVNGEIERLVEREFITQQQAMAVEPHRIFDFFSSPLGRELRTSPALRREFKFSLLVPAARYYPNVDGEEQVLLQGVVDCYFETADGITVVDFKTDRVFGERLTERAGEYAPQLMAYGEALERITGKKVNRKLLWFFSEGRAVEV